MHNLPNPIRTLRHALEELEGEGSHPDVLKSICRDVRQLIEALQRLEQADDDTLVEFVEKMFLRRKGITVVSFKSGAHVRERLEAKGFTRLAQDVSNETLVEHMDTYVSNQDTALAEIEERIVEGAAGDVVEEVGLEWPEPSET